MERIVPPAENKRGDRVWRGGEESIFSAECGICVSDAPSKRKQWEGERTRMDNDSDLRQQLIEQLKSSNAHANFQDAIADFPEELRGKRPKGAPHSAWEELEHMRITLWDILEFSRDPDHKSPKWPEGYWPETPEPPDPKAWDRSVHGYCQDLQSLCALVADDGTDLHARIPHGTGQTVLREALLAADHNAYHLGQLVLVRRMLGAWGVKK